MILLIWVSIYKDMHENIDGATLWRVQCECFVCFRSIDYDPYSFLASNAI